MQGVVQGPEIGINFLLQIAGKKAKTFASFHSWPREDQSLNLSIHEHAHSQDRRQKGFSRTGGPERKREVMALHRIHVLLLTQGARTQQVALLVAGEHLIAHGDMILSLACI